MISVTLLFRLLALIRRGWRSPTEPYCPFLRRQSATAPRSGFFAVDLRFRPRIEVRGRGPGTVEHRMPARRRFSKSSLASSSLTALAKRKTELFEGEWNGAGYGWPGCRAPAKADLSAVSGSGSTPPERSRINGDGLLRPAHVRRASVRAVHRRSAR